ncbi:histidine kinase dimerization/phosphoacceptor domain -containing protein [Novosphingobium sp. RD2P27]|uniref:histidine kinase n=1 Tax=Novosphingobium kalidii TaxID=3230299 RepID=A0ABV2CZX6_9SPHN
MTSFELSKPTDRIEQLPVLQQRPVVRYVITIVLSVTALAGRIALAPVLPPGYPFVAFLPVVMIATFFFGRATGLFAAILCGLFAWYFFIEPADAVAFDHRALTALAFYVLVVALNIALIHWLQATNARVREARERGRTLAQESARLAERSELLFQELQHRVGNNLQMVAAVLSLQLRSLDEPKARRAISDAVARVQVIGSIQRRLYRNNGELVPLDDFIREVSEQLMRSNGRPGITYSVTTTSDLVLAPEGAVPMALILAEALANATEHGFVGGETGEVRVVLERRNEDVILEVHDNGAGLPDAFDFNQADSLGLRISRVLSRQLNAEYALENAAPGSRMRLIIPKRRLTPNPC